MEDKKDKSSIILKRFGRYLILDHLVDGGMAKICRARFLGDQADKIVAIKMVQQQYTQDKAFVKMFLDEIKVTFGLIHPNIAQTYDTGMIDEQLFAAMEYVDGKNLKQFLDRLKERNFVFPVEISVHIISQACQALNYAHHFTDKLTGKPIKIIHRDVSPHNIMITYDGTVKVIDFGIAKADSNTDATQAGTIKGKLSYLAPEYLEGMTLDHTYDQFAIGVTLWELLCSRKLFKAKNELAVLKLIQSCKVPPPSSINPNVPKELDEIVLKSLKKDRSQRYENMDQLNRALVRFLYSNYPEFNPTDLSYFAKELFKEEIKLDREKLVEFGKIDLAPYLKDVKTEKRNGVFDKKVKGVKKVKIKGNVKSKKNGTQVFDFGFNENEGLGGGRVDFFDEKIEGKNIRPIDTIQEQYIANKKLNSGQTPIDLKDESKTSFKDIGNVEDISQIKGLENVTVATKSAKRSDLYSPASVGTQYKTISQPRLNYKEDDEDVKSPQGGGYLALIAASVVAFAYIYFSRPDMVQVPAKNSSSSIERPNKSKVEEVIKTGKVYLKNTNVYQRFYLNGEEVQLKGLGYLEVPLGSSVIVKVSESNKKSFEKEVLLTSNNDQLNLKVPELERLLTGEILSDLNFNETEKLIIYFDDGKQEFGLPITKPIRLPAGSYEAYIENSLYKTKKKIELNIEPDKRIRLSK